MLPHSYSHLDPFNKFDGKTRLRILTWIKCGERGGGDLDG